MRTRNFSLMIATTLALLVVAPASRAQEPRDPAPATGQGEKTHRVQKTVRDMDVHRIVEDALSEALKALEAINIEAEVKASLDTVDIDEVVREAVEESRNAVDAARIRAQVEEALRGVDIEETMKQAREEIEKAKEEIRNELEKLNEKESPGSR